MDTFTLTESACRTMILHCQKQAPLEACGLLSGRNNVATTCWCLTNTERSPYRFAMDPNEISDTFSAMGRKREQFYGIFHSHPTAAPYPSWEDIRYASYPEAVYVIVSLRHRRPVTQCYRIVNQKVSRVSLLIVP